MAASYVRAAEASACVTVCTDAVANCIATPQDHDVTQYCTVTIRHYVLTPQYCILTPRFIYVLASNQQLRNITRIRKYLDRDTCHLAVRALVLSRLDYGNALLLGSTSSDLQRLQRIQNWAAKLIHRAQKRDHATPYLKDLHWLPIRERITFKIMVYIFKCLHGLAPGYLTSCLHLYHPARSSLRSASDTTLLSVPNTRGHLHTASNRTFSHATPNTWNALPKSVRNSDSISIFKKSLKTQLYMH